MGCFSWYTCDTHEQIRNGRKKSVYALIPKEFGGSSLHEPCYEGYGEFGGKDIYELVTEWNKDFLDALFKWPNWKCSKDKELEAIGLKYMREGEAAAQVLAESICDERHYLISDWKRCIGIQLACYDEDNARLPYPIKIAGNAKSIYEDCEPSKSDPNQGMY